MRQETRIEQTCKLILMGFPKPYGTEEHQQLTEDGWVTISETTGNYTIGQLLDFLPTTATQHICYVATKKAWTLSVDVLGKSKYAQARCYKGSYCPHLIDALYDMCVKLKEKGVI